MKKIILIFLFVININVWALNQEKEVEEAIFSKCVDGDTAKFIVNNEEVVVRFLAIDTPESVKTDMEPEYMGKESSDYTCNRLKSAKKITLEYDQNSDKEDKYNRLLAFVYVDDKLLQKELVAKGYAKVAYVYGDYSYVELLRKEEEKAKLEKVGIWSEENNLPQEEDMLEKIWHYFQKVLSFIANIFA